MTNELQVRVVRALRFSGDRHWNYHGLIYPYNTIYYVTGGDGHIRANGSVTDMKEGYVYLIPSQLRHDIWCDSHVEKVYIDVHAELFPGYDVFSDTREVLCQHIGMDRCERMHQLCAGGMREQLALKGELLLTLSDFMATEPKPVSPGMVAFLPMVMYIQENLSAQLRRDELATRFGWNPSVLSRTFKQVFGCGIKQYVEKLLTLRLSEELLETNKPLHRLAEEYGFCDGYYLSAFFKRNMGISPQLYRKYQRRQ
ncbi:MAG: helix-turn-helix transcriptional regulator [Lachnospiraceae bacterium]|nr:helix-turn-helix transcriptional regulator [Lachnospiraceae bacterium]